LIEYLPGVVVAAVIHHYDFEVLDISVEHLESIPDQYRQGWSIVVCREEDAERSVAAVTWALSHFGIV
jgi:hypothetical protein